MTNVVIMGGSAGAHMTAQYGALLADPAYAADVGIEPGIDVADVKGLVVFSAPLRAAGFGWRMNAILWAYLGTQDLENSQQAREFDIMSHDHTYTDWLGTWHGRDAQASSGGSGRLSGGCRHFRRSNGWLNPS